MEKVLELQFGELQQLRTIVVNSVTEFLQFLLIMIISTILLGKEILQTLIGLHIIR